jgi:threonine dehydrogenase-like Zn-dependent dehydrogenase
VPQGVHVAFDAAGTQASLDACLSSLRPRGTLLNVAIWEDKATVNINLILSRELNVTGECRVFLSFFFEDQGGVYMMATQELLVTIMSMKKLSSYLERAGSRELRN